MSDLISAKEVLWKHRRQLDADGIEVGVSRQALDVVLEELSRRTPSPAPSAGLSEKENGAVKNLTEHQGQCDEDGVTVKVSREALDVALALVRRLLPSKPDPEREAMGKVWVVMGSTGEYSDHREWFIGFGTEIEAKERVEFLSSKARELKLCEGNLERDYEVRRGNEKAMLEYDSAFQCDYTGSNYTAFGLTRLSALDLARGK